MTTKGLYVPHVLKAVLELGEQHGSSVVSIIHHVETLVPCRNANDNSFPAEVYHSLLTARDDGLLLEEVRGKYKLALDSNRMRKCLWQLIESTTHEDDAQINQYECDQMDEDDDIGDNCSTDGKHESWLVFFRFLRLLGICRNVSRVFWNIL